jgi:hypothetical protein
MMVTKNSTSLDQERFRSRGQRSQQTFQLNVPCLRRVAIEMKPGHRNDATFVCFVTSLKQNFAPSPTQERQKFRWASFALDSSSRRPAEAEAIVHGLGDTATPSRNSQILALITAHRDEVQADWTYEEIGPGLNRSKGPGNRCNHSATFRA